MAGWLVAGIALGIAIADASGAPPWLAVLPALVGLACAPRWRAAAAATLALAVGLHAQATRLTQARAAAAGDPREVVLEGVVARRASALAPRWLELEDVRGAGVARLRVFASQPGDLDAWLPGDSVRTRVRLAPLSAARNPGHEDPLRRLRRAGLAVGATLPHPSLAAALAPASGPRARLHRLRARIAAQLAASGAGSELLRGLALGDEDALSPAAREAFHRLGLEHALSVSGLHLAWVSAAAYGIARALLRRSAGLAARADTRRLALAGACAVAFAYAALAGWSVPARRALLVVLAIGVALLRRRPQRTGAALAAAALWILAVEPDALFHPGAQLSFAAMAAFAWRLGRPAHELRGRTTLRTSATAIAATAPIVAWHGGGVSLAALAANAIALPWLECIVLPAALVAALAAGVGAPGSEAVIGAASALADLTIRALGLVAGALPALDRAAPAPAWWIAALALAACGLAVRATAVRAAIAVVLAALLAAAPPARVLPAPPRLVVLDVGQGDAALVQGARGAVLIDGGPAHDDFDAGARRVLPALRALGVARIDLMIATHADLDHRGGLPAVLRSVPVAELWLPFGTRTDPGFAELIAAAESAGARVSEAGRGSPRRRIGELTVDPLWPPRLPAVPGARSSARNERSLVVRIDTASGSRVLLPGDLDARAEARLLASQPDLRADVLLLPHHGSRGSSSPAFLDAVAARLAIASAPCRSRFGMPHPEVRARLVTRAVPLAWTGRDGAVRLALVGPLSPRGTGAPARCP